MSENRTSIVAVLCEIFGECGLAVDAGRTVDDSTRLIEDLHADSVTLLQVLLSAESKFGIELDFGELGIEALKNVGTLAGVIQERTHLERARQGGVAPC